MSELKVSGKITSILDVEKGTSKAGKDWQKQNFVIDTGEKFNNIICFQVFGVDKCEALTKYNKVGDVVNVSFNVSSREYNGKYYHNLDAWMVKLTDENVNDVAISVILPSLAMYAATFSNASVPISNLGLIG